MKQGVRTQEIIAILSAFLVGESRTYAELADVLGFDVRSVRQSLYTAWNRLRADEGIVFTTIRGVGIMRLDDAAKVEALGGFIGKVHRVARRGRAVGNTINLDALEPKSKTSALTGMSVLGTLAAFTTKRAVTRIEGRVEKSKATERLDVGKTLEAFRRGEDE
jgi:hypothetical protein